jgi:hypothetical protein
MALIQRLLAENNGHERELAMENNSVEAFFKGLIAIFDVVGAVLHDLMQSGKAVSHQQCQVERH